MVEFIFFKHLTQIKLTHLKSTNKLLNHNSNDKRKNYLTKFLTKNILSINIQS